MHPRYNERWIDPRSWRRLGRPKRQVCVVVIGHGFLGAVESIRYMGAGPGLDYSWPLSRQSHGKWHGWDSWEGKGGRRRGKYLLSWGRGTVCTVAGCTVHVHSMDLTQTGHFLAHTEYPALLSITAQLADDEVGGDSPSPQAPERPAILPH